MKYMGSKARIAKTILPIIIKDRIEGQYYVEPFCGGCNMIDKVDGNRIANDTNEYLVAMFKELQAGWVPPLEISRDHYSDVRTCYRDGNSRYTPAYIGYVGFTGSYNGRFFDGGYSGRVTTKNGSVRDYITEARNNLMAQIGSLKDVDFSCKNYKDLIIPPRSIIYCDPPYEGVKKYSYSINHDEFWDWCRLKVTEGHKVFISEYNAPKDFICVYEQGMNTTINQTVTKKAVERLFIHESQEKKKQYQK